MWYHLLCKKLILLFIQVDADMIVQILRGSRVGYSKESDRSISNVILMRNCTTLARVVCYLIIWRSVAENIRQDLEKRKTPFSEPSFPLCASISKEIVNNKN